MDIWDFWDIVTTNDQESPLVGDISLSRPMSHQTKWWAAMYCFTAIHFPEKKEKREERSCFACASFFFATAKKKREGHLFHRLILHHGMSTKLHLGEWKWPKKRKKEMKAAIKMKKGFCQKWDSNPRPHSWTRTFSESEECYSWVWRLRPLGHPDILALV